MNPELHFEKGSLVLKNSTEKGSDLGHPWVWDIRTESYRALAYHYSTILKYFISSESQDCAKSFKKRVWQWHDSRSLRPYQSEALEAWRQARGKGVVVLPTGAGKSLLAMNAIYKTGRDALIVVPTLDLMAQWIGDLERVFSMEIGQLGGGIHDIREVTVATYDSAHLHMEHLGHQFGMLVFDECHHLPSASHEWIAKMSIAPFRLGLSATPERNDGGEYKLINLIGPEVYRVKVQELKGEYLSDYETIQLEVEMDPDEQELFQSERALYTNFIREENIDMSHPAGWSIFLQTCFKSSAGKRAYRAYLTQKKLAHFCRLQLHRTFNEKKNHK